MKHAGRSLPCSFSARRRTLRRGLQRILLGRATMADRLKYNVAILFGAGSVGPGWGNGKATAVLFARNGAHVICIDVNREAAQETADIIQGEGGAATAFACDVTNSDAVKEVVD